MNQIKLHARQYCIPDCWEDLNRTQMMGVAPYLLGTPESLPLRKTLVLFVLIPRLQYYWTETKAQSILMRFLPWTRKVFLKLTDFQKWDLLGTCDWLFNGITGKSIVREFKHDGIRYLLPEDNLMKESIIAFAFADNYFNQFVESGDPKFIQMLIGCIARQERHSGYRDDPTWEGDPREPFATERAATRAEAFKTLSPQVTNSILLYFMGAKKHIHHQYAVIFIKDDPEHNDLSAQKKSFGRKKVPKPDFGWLGIIYELAEAGTFGNFDRVKHMFLHTCCYYLAKKRYDVEEQTK